MRPTFGLTAFSMLACVQTVFLEAAAARPLERELPRGRQACWERSYDAAHLAAHPLQKVVRVRLLHLPGSWREQPYGFYVQLSFKLRGSRSDKAFDYQLGGFCKAAGNGLRCTPQWDAGAWRLSSAPGGALDVGNDGLIANPDPYDAEEIADDAVRIPAKPDDGVWRLTPARGRCEL